MKKLTVYKHNDLVEASYGAMSLLEQLMLLSCIAKSDPRELTAETPVEITVSEFAQIADIEVEGAYDDLKRAVRRLFHRYLVIHNPDPDDPALTKTETRWVHAINYYNGEGRIRLYFAPKVLPYLSELSSRFTKYKLQHVAQFKSSYGVRLYELLMQWQCKGKREVQIDWLRERWGLENKYKNIVDLKKRVIEPAMKDINEYSNLWVKLEQRKKGRKVVWFSFAFGPKESKKHEPESKQTSKRLTVPELTAMAKPGETWDELGHRLIASGYPPRHVWSLIRQMR